MLEQQADQYLERMEIRVPDKPEIPDVNVVKEYHEAMIECLDSVLSGLADNNGPLVAEAVTGILYSTALIGRSMGLPLELLLREIHKESMETE